MLANAVWPKGWFLVTLFAFWLCGCQRRVPIDDPSLKPFTDMYAADRAQYGLSPLPKDARVFVENDPSCYKDCGYDAMLHIYGKAFHDGVFRSHDVAFRKENGVFKWVGETEECWGPREYRTVNGRFKENLVISYFQHTAGQLDGLHISYSEPDDPMGLGKVPITKAKEILRAWRCE